MKLVTNTQITVDGVMQANGGNNPFVKALNTRPKFVASNTITNRSGPTPPCFPAISRPRSVN